jgi:hypothetical protein
MEDEIERERVECLVQQGFTPTLARKVLVARSREHLPLTIWIVDNSASMRVRDGRKLVSTQSQDDVRHISCTRMEELKETVTYHAQLAALLEAPTKFLMLNGSDNGAYPQELSIAERGSEWIEDDMEYFLENLPRVRPKGATPLTNLLRRIYQSLMHTPKEGKIVLVLATDGRPTDTLGFVSSSVDRHFENALKELQSKAWIVIRLCTNDETILKYYQKLDDQLELSLEVLDDYTDEAKEVYQYNPWLTYSLCLHRCREMGMSCHPTFRFLDWLDERPLARNEIGEVLKGTFGLLDNNNNNNNSDSEKEYESIIKLASQSEEDWNNFCEVVQREQDTVALQRKEEKNDDAELGAFFPWNPIQKRTTHWVDIGNLKRHGCKTSFLFRFKSSLWFRLLLIVPVVLVAIYVQTLY